MDSTLHIVCRQETGNGVDGFIFSIVKSFAMIAGVSCARAEEEMAVINARTKYCFMIFFKTVVYIQN